MQDSISLINKISDQAKLPFKVISGTAAKRNKKAALYNERFRKELEKYCKNEQCSVDNFKKSLDRTLEPYKINYVVMKEDKEQYSGSMGSIAKVTPGKSGEVVLNYTGYKFLLPLNENIITDKYTAIHESRHFFDKLFNPKQQILRCYNLIKAQEYEVVADRINSFFFLDINEPARMRNFKDLVGGLIDILPTDIAIETLQKIRYGLITEINAYRDEAKYMLKTREFKNAFVLIKFLIQNCKFKSKLKYVENKLRECIKTERANIKKQHFSQEIQQNP